MISRKEGDWIVFYEGDEERFRCKLPKDVTMAEIERFIEHLKKIAKEKEAGPN